MEVEAEEGVERQWAGDIPVFLLILRDGQQHVIDLDERGWATTYADLMRGQSTWHLVSKASVILFSMVVADGEQPYYTARHFSRVNTDGEGEQAHAVAYGIGKKRIDGHVDRIWILDNGQVCIGDDVDIFGRATLAAR